MTGELTLDALKRAVKEGEIDTVLCCMADMQGRLIGKRFHAQFFVDGGWEETHGCDYLLADDIDMEPVPGYAAASWARGYGDFVMKPDLSTLRRVPWLEATALVLCDVLDHHHHDVPHSPRQILKKQVARLNDRKMRAYFASELEFYLFDESFEAIAGKRWHQPKTAGLYIEDYHILQTTKEEPVMRAVRNGLQGAGIPVENSKGEWGPGQEEINVRYADALTMADRHVIMKNGIKEIAHLQGKAVTFMSKWRYDLAGSSAHVHASLWSDDGATSLFADPKGEFGMSPLMRSYVAGQLKYAAEMTLLLAPYINSYKRFQAGTFAPTKMVWSRDNRTAGFRLCGEESKAIRIECRIGGADLNPYLAFAGLIAAGLAGIDEKLELDPPHRGDAYGGASLPEIPKTLRAATDAFAGSAMLRAALGDEVVEHYAHAARWEQFEYDRRITDWELMRGFERS
ncbi:glutamine synthetase family protein [Terrarubrum flagellatum]|uniref:glutamine synthetase family protein n=1 Tax=Terrirubrum flagellatum TaxID=2895980 RepID=UPI0031452D18